jgi:head-tail adaptor
VRPGRALTRRLVLEAAEIEPDGGGGGRRAWRAVGVHWAELRAISGSEGVAAGVEGSRVSHRITLRWAAPGAPSRPRPSDRFREGDRVYDITAVAEADSSNRHLVCWAVEGRAA